MSGAFAAAALQLRALGLAPIPCQGDDGKVPGIRTRTWKGAPKEETYRQLILRFPDENIGLLTGLSRIFVVDIDEATMLAEMLRRFGYTPLMVETPSGGIHLYYRAHGEPCHNMRQSEGLPIDLKGIGGFTVCPPSVRPSGPHKGGRYRLVRGDWEAVRDLPPINPGSLPAALQKPLKAISEASQRKLIEDDFIPDGERGIKLLRIAQELAPDAPDKATLLGQMLLINQQLCIPPATEARVRSAVNSAWKYQQEDRNFAKTGPQVFHPFDEIKTLMGIPGGGNAYFLLGMLRMRYFRGEPFAISPRAMAREDVMAGWSEREYRAARELLVELGCLIEVRPGGRGPRDPALFNLGRKNHG
jgi:hypothetical protein